MKSSCRHLLDSEWRPRCTSYRLVLRATGREVCRLEGRITNRAQRTPMDQMDTSTRRERLPEIARAATEPSPRGAQVRRRMVAVGGFALLVAGFLVAVGAGLLV